MTYSEKLKDPRWQRKRLHIFERDNFSCRSCESITAQLQVHHAYYLPKFNPWDYPDDSLVTLCDKCHQEQTARIPRLMMQNTTPQATMFNTELLERANASPETMGAVMELAYALSLSVDGDNESADAVMRPLIESLSAIAAQMEMKGRMATL